MQSWAPAGDRGYTQTLHFADLVNSLAGGRLVIDPYPAGAIVPVKTEHEALMKGTIEISHVGGGWLEPYNRAGPLFAQWVNGLTGSQLALWYWQGEGVDMAREMMAGSGELFLSPFTLYTAEVWAESTKRLDTLDDLKGLKMRVGVPVLVEIFKQMGVSAVVLSGAEVYESMKRGVIDAFEYVTPAVNWSNSFQEVAHYVYLSPVRAPSDSQELWVNEATWNKLDPDLQQLVLTTSNSIVGPYFAEGVVADIEAIQNFKDYGCEVLPVPKEIDDELSRIAAPVYDKIAAEDPFYKKVLESQRAWKAACLEMGIQ
jgi:TRAP-type mannitol/chloroaromatic compound transport system substrate-binding protein